MNSFLRERIRPTRVKQVKALICFFENEETNLFRDNYLSVQATRFQTFCDILTIMSIVIIWWLRITSLIWKLS